MGVIEYIKQATEESSDIKYRTISIGEGTVQMVYNEAVTDSMFISNVVIRSVSSVLQESFKQKSFEKEQTNELITRIKNELNAVNIMEIFIESSDIFYYIFSGYTLLVIEDKILAVETKGHLDRSISEPQIESDIKGSKDCFIENYMQNIGLIRKRIKTEKLVLKENIVGRRSKTKAGILYLSDVADVESVKRLEDEIKKIDIDGILDSNYVREIILSKGDSTVFPTVISTERPDVVAYNLLEGRIAIVIENSPFALVFPAFFTDFFKSMDDYYQINRNIFITRTLRYIAFFITLFLPAIYVALITFNHEVIPSELLVSFTVQRDGVPAPAFLEALLMILAFELLREGDYRVPSMAGSALSIVGALILGDAAVSAGIVSSIMIIVIAITNISALIFTDINMINTLRYWRIVFLLSAALAGLIGIFIAVVIFVIKMASINSLDRPYLFPFSPFDKEGMKDTFARENISEMTKRSDLLTDNITRQK